MTIDVSVHREVIQVYIHRQATLNSYRRRYVEPDRRWYEGVRLRVYEPDPTVYSDQVNRLKREVEGHVVAYLRRSYPDVVGYVRYIDRLHRRCEELEQALEQKKREADRFFQSELQRLDFTIDVVKFFGRRAADVKFGATVTVGVIGAIGAGVKGAVVGVVYTLGNDLIKAVTSPEDADVYAFTDTGVEIGWTAKNSAVSAAVTQGAVRSGTVASGVAAQTFKDSIGRALGTPQALLGSIFAFMERQDDRAKFR